MPVSLPRQFVVESTYPVQKLTLTLDPRNGLLCNNQPVGNYDPIGEEPFVLGADWGNPSVRGAFGGSLGDSATQIGSDLNEVIRQDVGVVNYAASSALKLGIWPLAKSVDYMDSRGVSPNALPLNVAPQVSLARNAILGVRAIAQLSKAQAALSMLPRIGKNVTASNTEWRSMKIPKKAYDLIGTSTDGRTSSNGTVYLRPGMSLSKQAHTLKHESVHSFLSVSDNAFAASKRQALLEWGYHNSAFLNATEEILAEGITSVSFHSGWRHAFNGAYTVRRGTVVTRLNFTLEAAAGSAGLGALGYGGYRLGNWLWEDR